ncbi:MAG: response regulator [Gammaproteobacteria bacterium]|nr:response regulator [Gammaproteobacteria bacterium]
MTSDVEFIEKPVDIKALLQKIKKLAPHKTPNILVVEDDEPSRELLLQALQKAGWNTIEAINGNEALTQLQTHQPTLILLDLMMPEIDGFYVLKEIQNHPQWKKIPVIVITAKALTNKERIFLNEHTQDLFLKEAYSLKNFVTTIINRIRRGKR